MSKKVKEAGKKYSLKSENIAVQIDPAQLTRKAIILKRHGEPFGVVVSIDDYRAYKQWKKRQAPEDDFPPAWHKEKAAFQKMLPELLKTHRERFVAVHKGQVVDSDENEGRLWWRMVQKYGERPVYYIGEVLEKPRVYRVTSAWYKIK